MQKLASSIVGDTPAKPEVMSSDPDSCNIGGYDIHINQMRSMVKALIDDCGTIMRQEVLLGLNTEWIQQLLAQKTPILDAVNNGAHAYSFITEPRNPFLRHKNDLLRHMFDHADSHYVGRYDDDEKIDQLNVKALASWMTGCRRLEDLLGVLFHVTSSQPARAKEYESFLIRNTTTGEHAFFWTEETVAIFQNYSKTDGGPKAKLKPIVRFLPHCQRRLFLEYLSLVRPVQAVVAMLLWGGEAAALYQDVWFVQEGRVGVSSTISSVMRKEFSKHCGAPIRVAKYRHLTAYFSAPIHAEVEALQKEPMADSAGHSRQTEGRLYGQNECDHRSIDRVRWREFKFVALKWHWRLHLSLHETQHTTPPQMPGSATHCTHANGSPSWADFAASLHTSSPARPSTENDFWPCASKRRRLFCKCDGHYKARDPLQLIDPEAMHLAEAVLKCFGHAAWKIPQQGVATAMALNNCRDFIAILPTGFGKSFVYMAPAKARLKTVVVIVPLFMLIIDHLTECKARGISCADFRVGTINPTHPPEVVFVPVEIAITDGFQIWAKQLIAAHALHCIVIDEVYLVLAPYCHRMSQLFLLSCLDCQLIGLTASLVPDQEIRVNSTLGRDFVIICAKTTRPNLEYGVKDANDMDTHIANHLQRWLATDLAPQDRALVYCMTKLEVEELHKDLEERNVPNTFLHASVRTKEDKV